MQSNVLRCSVGVAALCLFVMSALHVSYARTWPDTTSGIHVFNDQLPSQMPDALVQFCATHYDGCQKMLRSDANLLRDYNPSFLILHYRLGLGLGYREPDALGDPTGPYINIIEGDNWVREWPDAPRNEWFYPYAGSQSVYNNMWGWYLIEPDNASWMSYWLGEVNRQLAANDNDGLFADSVSVPNYLDPTFFTPELPWFDPTFEADWSARIGRWITNVKAGLSVGGKLIPNAGFWITTRDATDYSGADGVMIEGFAAWGQTDPFDPVDWQLQMDRILNLVARDKIVIAQAYIDRPEDTASRIYFLANYLLIKGNKTFVNLDMGMDPEWFPEYGVDVGSFTTGLPTGIGELYRADWGVYAREYANGLALVNPNGGARTFDVGPGYQMVTPHGGGWAPADGNTSAWYLSYAPVSSITLQPFSGAVLVKSTPTQGHLSVTPTAGFSSFGTQGGPFFPPSARYTLTNTGSQPLDWTATHLPAAAWNTISPTSGTLAPSGSVIVTVTINSTADGLPSGTYNDATSFTNATSGDGNTAQAVQLSIAGPQPSAMAVTPSDGFSSLGLAGGPFSPVSLQYAVSNMGDSPLDFTVEHGPYGNWLSLCNTLPGHYDQPVTVAISDLARALGPGLYQDTIIFTNVINDQGNTTRAAQLAVLTPGNLWVTPADGLSSTGQVGGPFTPSSKQYSLVNTGGAPINWTASHNAPTNWVTLSSTSGVLAAGASITVTVSINSGAGSLTAGIHSDTVTFTNTTNGAGNAIRPVSLTVGTKTLTSVAVTPSTLLCPSKDPRQLRATAYFSDSTTIDVSLAGTWTSSRPSTCTVNSGGVVTPVAQGSANVTFSYTYSGITMQGACAVSVSYQTIWYLYMSPTGYTSYNRIPVQFTCQARTTSGWLNVTDACQWTSSAPTVATVDFRGLVTPVARGYATITARYIYNGSYMSAQGVEIVQ